MDLEPIPSAIEDEVERKKKIKRSRTETRPDEQHPIASTRHLEIPGRIQSATPI